MLKYCVMLVTLALLGCSAKQPAPAPQGIAYGPLGFVRQEHGTYLKPPPTAIDLNLKELGALQSEQRMGDRTYIGWGLCAVRNE